jgi:hypothetical protein
MATQEELSVLFDRNLSLTPQAQPLPPQQPPQAIKYSISSHYHHSAHQAPSPSTDPSRTMTFLKLHGIDPASIPSYKMAVFESVGPEDRAELVELWKRGDPGIGTSVLPLEFTNITSSEYAEDNYQTNSAPSTDTAPMTGGDGRNHPSAEPYIVSGYNESNLIPVETFSPLGAAIGKPDRTNNWSYEYNRATDPVYAEVKDDGRQTLAYQYGAYEQTREYAGRAMSEPAQAREGNREEDTEMGG